MTGPIVIRELLLEMDRNLVLLDELASIPRADFLHDPRTYLLAERCFQLAIQCLLGICSYLAALKGWPKPEDSREAILLMGEREVLPREFAQRISGMAGFRNVLVHAYLKINREIVHDYLGRLDDFRSFARHIEVHLEPGRE